MPSTPIDLRDRPPYDPDQFSIKPEYRDDVDHILVSGGEIEDRITRLAEEISQDYQDRDGDGVYLICTLKGAMQYFATLAPQLEFDAPVQEGFLRANRYSDGTPGDGADVTLFTDDPIDNMDVLVVEDMIDQGTTLDTILTQLNTHNPNTIDTTVLFDKPANRTTNVDIAHTGFTIPDEFVVGYGIDYDERYRRLRHLAVL